MRYLTSIVVTVFSVIASVAFGMQLAFYVFAPPAQFIVIFFLLAFTVLVWLAEAQTIDNGINQSLYYRMISEHVVFPFTAYVIQAIIAILYFLAWNMSFNVFSVSMKLMLPRGIFTPLIIELLLFFVVMALWLGNNKANERTDTYHEQHRVKENQSMMLEQQVALLRPRIDDRDQASVDALRLIEQKMGSISLNLTGVAMIRYQEAAAKVTAANQMTGVIPLETLLAIKKVMDLIR